MFLHHNEFLVWKNGDEMIIASFRILGELAKADGKTICVPQPEFWDTSRNKYPTTRVLLGVQFQFIGINPEDLVACRVLVSTNNGSPVRLHNDFREDGDRFLEYRSYYPMVVQVDNDLYNKRTTFEVYWDREPHARLKKEFVFHLRVERREEDTKSVKLQPTPGNGDNGHGEKPVAIAADLDPETIEKIADEQCAHGTDKNGGRNRRLRA